MVRKYEQRVRAERQEATRERIVRAAVELHGSIGPADTSLSAVAERAGVQRNTLYRYFPDERSLLTACSGLHLTEVPVPTVETWLEVTDPLERVRRGLRDLYGYYESDEQMTAHVLRDAERDPVVREITTMRMAPVFDSIEETLVAAWPARQHTDRLRASIRLAISFRTWQTLVRESGLDLEAAIAIAVAPVEAASTASMASTASTVRS